MRVHQAMDFIRANLDREIPLEEVAEASAMSKFHFHRVFRLVVGETVASYTRRVRLQAAAAQLVVGRESVTEIAHRYGFSSAQNFATALKRVMGKTPTQIQQQTLDEIGYHALPVRRHPASDVLLSEPKVGERPGLRVVYARAQVQYSATAETVRKSIGAYHRVTRWAINKGLPKRPFICATWDYPAFSPDAKCVTDFCLSLPETIKTVEEGLATQTLPGGTYLRAEGRIKGLDYDSLYMAVVDWMDANSYQLTDGPGYESYEVPLLKVLSGSFPITAWLPIAPRPRTG